MNLAMTIFLFSSLDFSEISEGRRVKSFRKFLKGEGLNRLRKFTGQGTCSHIHSEVFLGNMHCFWDSVLAKIGAAKNVLHLQRGFVLAPFSQIKYNSNTYLTSSMTGTDPLCPSTPGFATEKMFMALQLVWSPLQPN